MTKKIADIPTHNLAGLCRWSVCADGRFVQIAYLGKLIMVCLVEWFVWLSGAYLDKLGNLVEFSHQDRFAE